MTDHANELRRHARKIAHPAGDVPAVMRAAADEIERLRAEHPEGWFRAIEEALVVAHTGVANTDDTYEEARAKLERLIGFHVDVATDPAVNGGWKLVPIEPTEEMRGRRFCRRSLLRCCGSCL